MSGVALDGESAEQREERLAREGHDPECTAHYPLRRCDCRVSKRAELAAMAYAPENGLNQGRPASRGLELPVSMRGLELPVGMSPRVAATLAAYRDAAREVRAAQAAFQAAQTKWKQALDEHTEAILAED